MQAARERGDECGPESWRHEIAHPISPARGRTARRARCRRRAPDISPDRQRRVDRASPALDRARPRDSPPSRAPRREDHRLHAGCATSHPQPAPPASPPSRPWRSYYRAWPHLLIVLADQSRERMRQRIQRTLALHQSDPARPRADAIPVSFVALEELLARKAHSPRSSPPPSSPDSPWTGSANHQQRTGEHALLHALPAAGKSYTATA